MPPKKEEKKEIVRIFEPRKFWLYTAYPQDAVDKTTTFLTTFEKQLSQLISQEKSLEQNFQILCDKIGVAVHPCFQNLQKEESKYPELRNKQYGPRYVQVLNFKMDIITIKLLTFLLTYFKVNSIKLSRNQLTSQSEYLKKLLDKESSASTLFFEWNPLLESPNRKQLFVSAVRPCVQHLILRQNSLGNAICIDILTKIKETPQIVLKSLDLTGNQLTPDISPVLCKFLEEQKNIEFLGLSKNKLCGNQFLAKLFSSIGEVLLTEQDFVKYQQSVKARDQVIERNKKKKKGAPDEALPFVFEVKQTEKGKCFVKNMSLQNLNIAKNGITDQSLSLIKSFAQNQGSKIQVFLDSNKLTKKSRDILQIYKNLLF